MIELIERARKLFPHDGIKQFYQVIREPLENIICNATDLKNESFESDQMHIVKQMFSYNGILYCWWVSEFPNYCGDDKRNVYYGLDIHDGRWKLLWTELDVAEQMVFIMRMRHAAKLDDKDLIHTINPFEKAIDNAPFSSDIHKQYQIIIDVLNDFMTLGSDSVIKKTQIFENTKFKFYFFKIYGVVYMWAESYIDGCLEAFQLEALYNSRVSYVLFANCENADPMGVIALKLLEN